MKRSLSQERRLSGQKAKITSPSPTKKNSWREEGTEEKSEKQTIPKIPIGKKHTLNISSVSERRVPPVKKEELDERVNKSMVNLNDLKKIKVFQIEKPKDKKFRRIEEKDRVLLDFLGLPA